MRITGTGFEFFGKKYENDNENTSAATTISEAQSELSTFFGKEINKEKLSQITETEAATNNSEEREQVLTTAAALYIVKREYTESLNASSRAISSRKFSQSASSMLKAAAKSLNETKENGDYEKQYQDLIAKAESLDTQSENIWLQEVNIEIKTDELKSVTEQAQEVTATIKHAPEELRKDEELAALIDRATEFDETAEELYVKHEELAKESKSKIPQYTAEIAQDENNNTIYNISGDDGSKSTITTDSEGNIYIKNESGDEATLTFNENNQIKNTVIKKQNQSITTIETDENEVPFIQEYEINSNDETLVYEQGIDSADNIYYAFNQDEDEDPILGEYELMVAENNYNEDSEYETEEEYPGVDLPELIENEDSATDEAELPEEYEEEGTISIPDDEIEVIINPKDEEIEEALTEAEETSEAEKAEESKKVKEEAKTEEETKAEAEEEKLIQEKGYNRQDPTRNAIANHDEVYAYNGLENGLEENYKGVLLDLDTYYDQFSYLGEDSEGYSSNVQYAIERDISNYFDIDLSSSTAQEELKSVYRQMLNNANLDEPDIENAYEYNAAAKKLFLGLSTDKCFENDYISLDGIKVGAEPQKQVQAEPQETEKPATDEKPAVEEKPEAKEEVKKEEKKETKKSEETKKAEKTEETKKEEKTKSKEEAKKPETKEEVKKEAKAAEESKKTEKTEETKKAEKTETKEEVKKEEKKETKEAPKQESKPRTNKIKDNKINLND